MRCRVLMTIRRLSRLFTVSTVLGGMKGKARLSAAHLNDNLGTILDLLRCAQSLSIAG